jgi:H+/Cl- antiporter ClcA
MWHSWAVVVDWPRRRWAIAALSGVAVAVLVALPTAVIPNPVFGRAVAVTWWSYPVVVITGVLGGLLFATYVRNTEAPEQFASKDELDGASKLGMAGTLISFFAVGCPVCNKLVLLALGATGAVTWFAPVQPFLALASIVLMVVALRIRLANEVSCRITPIPTTPSGA